MANPPHRASIAKTPMSIKTKYYMQAHVKREAPESKDKARAKATLTKDKGNGRVNTEFRTKLVSH